MSLPFDPAVAVRADLPLALVVLLGLFGIGLLAWSAYADLFRGRLLPDLVPLLGLCGFVLVAPFAGMNIVQHLILAAATALVLVILALTGGIGMGDVKLAPVIVLWLGWWGIIALMAGIMLAGAFAIPYWVWRVSHGDARRGHSLPLVPFLYGGVALVGWLADPRLGIGAVMIGLGVLAAGWVWHRRHPFQPGRTLVGLARPLGGVMVLEPTHPARVRRDDRIVALGATILNRDRIEYALDDLLDAEAELVLLRTGVYAGPSADGAHPLRVERLGRRGYRVELDLAEPAPLSNGDAAEESDAAHMLRQQLA